MAVVRRFDDDAAPCGTEYASKRVNAIMRFYPRNEVQNPIEYASGMSSVMGEYPSGVVDIVSDPRTGIVRRQKFIPRIAEIAEACDKEMKRRKALRLNAAYVMWWRHRSSADDHFTLQLMMQRIGPKAVDTSLAA